MGNARRAKHLLSGLLRCGACGGGIAVISQTHIGCSAARSKGTCNNRKSVARTKVVVRVLTVLSDHLMAPELFRAFCKEFVAETYQLRAMLQTSHASEAAELAKTSHALEHLVQALIDGATASTVKDKMAELEARKAQLENDLNAAPAPQPVLHPNMSAIYHSKVSNLAEAHNEPDVRGEAAEALRVLVAGSFSAFQNRRVVSI
ncbi:MULTISPECIES: zinc ribbon domain-containing protein, partial [unclassified Ruegeria]